MNFRFKSLFAAALISLPAGLGAQTPIDPSVSLKVVSQPYPTKGTGYLPVGAGGGFLADFAIDFPAGSTWTFDDYLVWCIDPNRGISVPGGPYVYQAFTAQGFAGTSFGGANGYDVNFGDMGKIVWLVSDLRANWASYNQQQREDMQGSIWATFRGETPALANIQTANTDGWVVLYNGSNQTFLTRVSEPADAALVLTVSIGMALIVFARRRRA